MITLSDCSYTYNLGRADALHALRGVTLTVQRGELIAVIGRNGSGKSTLARVLSAALRPTGGSYQLAGVDMQAADALWQIRRRVGMVFQRPDDQLIAASVIDDIAFGPENLALPPDEINARVAAVIDALGLRARAAAALSELSAGEKQRTAIAGVLAMQPDCLILDEPTSMLTAPQARRVLRLARELRERSGAAVLHVTHAMDEAIDMDRVLVFERGALLLDGPPRAVFAERALLRRCGLVTPFVTAVGFALQERLNAPPAVLLHADELAAVAPTVSTAAPAAAALHAEAADSAPEPLLQAEHLAFTYLAGTPQAAAAVHDVSFRLARGRTLALIGGSQAGKSTLLDLIAGLRQPQAGRLSWADAADASPEQTAELARRRCAIVFQQPEDQLVEPIVGMDVAIGPRLSKLSPAESRALVAAALEQVGLDYEQFRLRYVHALSGGQRRRVALAGALARQPQLLLLDEPGAGLDPQGRAELAEQLRRLAASGRTTLIIAGAALDEFTLLADDVLLLAAGRTLQQTTRQALLAAPQLLRAAGLELPEHLALVERFGLQLPPHALERADAEAVAAALAQRSTGAGDGA